MLKEDKIAEMLSEYADSQGKALEEAQYTDSFDGEKLYNRLKGRVFKGYYSLALAAGGIAAAVFIICLLNIGEIGLSSYNLTLEESRINYTSAQLPKGEKAYLPSVLPKGFILTDSKLANNILTLEYGFGEYSLKLTQALKGGDFTDKSELEGMRRISISGGVGYLLETENGYKQLIWFKEGASLALVGNIDTKAMTEIAENVN